MSSERLTDQEVAEAAEENPCLYAGTEGECWKDEVAEEWCERCTIRLLADEVRHVRERVGSHTAPAQEVSSEPSGRGSPPSRPAPP